VKTEQSALVDELQVETLATASLLSSQPVSEWGATVSAAPTRSNERVVVVDTHLDLIADSDRTALDRTFNRPEITRALAGTMSSDVRPSKTLGTDLRYVAAPVVKNERIVAAVRFSLPEDVVQAAVRRTELSLAIFVAAVTLVAGVIAWLLASSIAAPVRALAGLAGRLHADLTLRAREDVGPAEVKAVARSLNQTAARLHDLVRRTERVAADASHHLRTPLTGIRLRLEGIEDMATEPELAAEAHHALGEVDRLAQRIDEVLALARTDVPPRETVDASAEVRARLAAFDVLAQEQGITLVSQVDDGAFVLADTGAVARVIDELLGNALTYARTTIGVTLTVALEIIELCVEDDGRGVPESEREHIFERGQRGSEAVPGGTGLGLAMVRETALAHDGAVWAEQGALGGLAVHVALPKA
jgi:signal transduction histidine kinase